MMINLTMRSHQTQRPEIRALQETTRTSAGPEQGGWDPFADSQSFDEYELMPVYPPRAHRWDHVHDVEPGLQEINFNDVRQAAETRTQNRRAARHFNKIPRKYQYFLGFLIVVGSVVGFGRQLELRKRANDEPSRTAASEN